MIQHATPPRFGTQPIEDDDLFALVEQICTDCGQSFQSSRRSSRCATCASLRTGQVGAARVICPVCDIEHAIPILKPHKLCLSCAADMTMTLASARVRYDRARETADALSVQLDADAAHADESTQARFAAAVLLRITGHHGATTYTQAQVDAAWQRALGKGDALSALLTLYDRAAAAALAVERAGAAARAVEEAIDL